MIAIMLQHSNKYFHIFKLMHYYLDLCFITGNLVSSSQRYYHWKCCLKPSVFWPVISLCLKWIVTEVTLCAKPALQNPSKISQSFCFFFQKNGFYPFCYLHWPLVTYSYTVSSRPSSQSSSMNSLCYSHDKVLFKGKKKDCSTVILQHQTQWLLRIGLFQLQHCFSAWIRTGHLFSY